MKKLSLQSLADEMPIINAIGQAAMNNSGYGSNNNPYSMNDAIGLLDNGTFSGGYVRDEAGIISYWMPELVVWGYYSSSYSQDLLYLQIQDNSSTTISNGYGYVNLDNSYGLNDFVSGLITACSNVNTGLDAGAGQTQVGSNFRLYYETKTGRVFHGNKYVGTTSLKGFTKVASKYFGVVGVVASVYNILEAYVNEGAEDAIHTAGNEAGSWVGVWGGAKAGVFVGSWAGPAGSLLGGIIGAIGGAMTANYIIETHKEQ